jgi:hypothetical protein
MLKKTHVRNFFEELQKAHIIFVMYVHLSVRMEQLVTRWMDFHEKLHCKTCTGICSDN